MPEQYVLKNELAKEVVKSMKPNLGGRRVMGNRDNLDIEIKENKILTDLKENSLKQNNHLQKISSSMSAMVGFEKDNQRRAKDQQTELGRELKRTMARGGALGGVAGSPKTQGDMGAGPGGFMGKALAFLTGGAAGAGGFGLLSKLRGSKLGGGTERMFGVNKGFTPRAAKKLGVGGTAKTLGKRSLGGLSKMATGKAGILSALFAIPSLALDYSDMKSAQAKGDEREEDLAKENMAGTGGAVAGSLAGAATGAAIGSVVPVIGTAIGGIIGGLIGGFGGSKLGEGLFKTREEKKAKEADKKKKSAELVKKMNANITPKDVKKEVEKVPEMKEAKKGIDMTKKETNVSKAGSTIMSKQVDYTDEAAKKFDEKIGKEISTFEKGREIDAKSAKEAEQYLKEGEKLQTFGTEDINVDKFMAVKSVTAEGDEDVKKFYTETYDNFRNSIDNYLKRSIKGGELDPKTGEWSNIASSNFYRRFYDNLISDMRNKIDNMEGVNPTKSRLLKDALGKAASGAQSDSMKSNLGKGGDKKSFFGKIGDFFKGIQGNEAGTAGDIAGEAAMQNAAGDQTETQKPGDKKSIFSKFKTVLKGLAKVSPVAAATMAIMDKNKMPEDNAQFGEIPEDQSLEGAQFGEMPTETKPKTKAERFLNRTKKMVLNPEDGKYYPPDSPVLKKFKPNELRNVKSILDSGETTQQASAMAVSNNNVNNVSNNSNQNVYTGKLNVDVDNYAERVNDF